MYVAHKQRSPNILVGASLNINPAASYSSIEQLYSTIGAGGLNGRVRDGIGCDTSAIATGNLFKPFKVPDLQLLNVIPSQLNTGTNELPAESHW
jgi:hypothetical protein